MRKSQLGEMRGLRQTAISWATSEITIQVFINRKATKYKIISTQQIKWLTKDCNALSGKTQPKESNPPPPRSLSLTHTHTNTQILASFTFKILAKLAEYPMNWSHCRKERCIVKCYDSLPANAGSWMKMWNVQKTDQFWGELRNVVSRARKILAVESYI